MKKIKVLLAAASVCAAAAASAQDFSAPQYAKWGDTPEARETNIKNINFLKEACDNKDYNAAAGYLKALIDACPTASSNIYSYGERVYQNRINRAKSVAEKNVYIDSLMLMYDLRNQYFGSDAKRGTAYILDRKARQYLQYKSADREGLRKIFKEAIAASGTGVDPDLVVVYFKNLCDDYANDEVFAEEVIAEYDRLSPLFDEIPDSAEAKNQFDACFGTSGVASCENLETLFTKKLAAAPDDETVLGQAVSLMSRAKCNSAFFFQVAEKYYEVKPSAETAMFLAQAFQNEGDFEKATKYLRETLAVEQDPVEKQKLYVRISVVEMAAHHYGAAAEAAREARSLNPEDGYPYFVLAQCYAASAAGCPGIAGQATYWAAYDTMNQAVERLAEEPETLENARKMLSAYRGAFPSSEECFFNELTEGARYTVTCGTAAGVVTTVRYR